MAQSYKGQKELESQKMQLDLYTQQVHVLHKTTQEMAKNVLLTKEINKLMLIHTLCEAKTNNKQSSGELSKKLGFLQQLLSQNIITDAEYESYRVFCDPTHL